MPSTPIPHFRRFVRDTRGSAGIELGFGAAVMLTVTMMCFDLYALVSAGGSGARNSVVMADYVSREATPSGEDLSALAEYLYQSEFDVPVSATYVISAVRRAAGDDPAELLWSDDTIRFGDDSVTEELAAECATRATQGWKAALLGSPITSGMAEEEVAVVAEVCARPTAQGWLSNWVFTGDIYHMHVLPGRLANQAPAQPVHAVETPEE